MMFKENGHLFRACTMQQHQNGKQNTFYPNIIKPIYHIFAAFMWQIGEIMTYIAQTTRYDSMPYRSCGNSGLKMPLVSLGLWHNFGDTGNFDNMKAMCFTAFDNGITHFDLANNYGPEPGSAERNFGKILKEDLGVYRDELLISTKAGYGMWDGPYGNWGSRKYLIASLDQSLKRMGLEYVDIFYHHRMDPNTPLEETMGALASIVQSGKALYAGLSNYNGETLEKAAAILEELRCPFVINQNRYSIFDRTIEENGLKETANRLNKGIIAFSPLAQGLLTNRYLNGIPSDSRIMTDGRFLNQNSLTEEKIKQIQQLNDIALSRGQSLAQMALSWVLKDNMVTSVLIGASKPEQILDNIKIIGRTNFTVDELARIDAIVSPDKTSSSSSISQVNTQTISNPELPPETSASMQTNAASTSSDLPKSDSAKTPFIHIKQRYSIDKKGNKIDNFFRAWIMANVQTNNDSILMKKKAAKEYTRFAEELCLTAYQTASDSEKKAFEKEWHAFSREYIHSCKTDKAYTTTLFGFVNINEDDLVNKIINEIETITKTYPASLGLEDLYRPLYVIMRSEADKLLH